MSWISDAFHAVGDWVVDRIEDIGNAIGDAANEVWHWFSENISGLPLHIFSFLGTYFPSWTFGDHQYFQPNHSDSDVNAVMSGSKWSGGVITYALPDSRADYQDINPSASGYKPLSAEGEAALHAIMASLAGFVNTGISYAGRNNATIQVAAFDTGSVITRSHAYYPGVPIYGGDTWLERGNSTVFSKGSNAYLEAMHELGHALGLKHTFDSAPGMPKMSAAHDSTEYTVMSYNETVHKPQTFMQYDIAALQLMYGADFTTNSDNTIYRWNSTTGEMYINGYSQGGTQNGRIFLTIWDGGGIDTYDMSNYSDNAEIDLSPGGFSRFSAAQLASGTESGTKVHGNLYNAFLYNGDTRSLIENAAGGSGNDLIKGNGASNKLTGNDGNDTLYGLNGADRLDGGNGTDLLGGGAGADSLFGGAGADALYGDESNDALYGGAGGDYLNGGTGDYDLAMYDDSGTRVVASLLDDGSAGDAAGDTYAGIEGLSGTYSNDQLTGDYGNNYLYGRMGDDLLIGNAGFDLLDGGSGNDTLIGGAGIDILDGGDGSDWVSYATSSGGVSASLADGRGYLGPQGSGWDAAGDTYFNVENLEGSNSVDVLVGNAGANWLKGLGSDDILEGRGGADTLEGGAGFNWASYINATMGVSANLKNAAQNTGEALGDVFISIQGLQGSNFSDMLTGIDGGTALSGLDGSDTLNGGSGSDNLDGGSGNDWLYGGAGADNLIGGSDGRSSAKAQAFVGDMASYQGAMAGVHASLSDASQNTGDAAGDSYWSIENLVGSEFTDVLTGDSGANWIAAVNGDDLVYGLGGDDLIWGQGGNDTLTGGSGADTLDGGDGVDWASYATSSLGVVVSLVDQKGYAGIDGGTDAVGDVLSGIENLQGGSGVDVLEGNAGANWLKGLGSDDILRGGVGADTLEGGSGFNWASYATATSGVSVNLKAASQNTGEAAGDVYIDIHGLQGSNYGDTLVGRDGGTALSGLGGNDTLVGGTGADNLDGGAGRDQFVFNTALSTANIDRISDFSVAEDTIVLDHNVFTALTTAGTLQQWNFRIGAGAAMMSDRIIYNNTTGELLYDADGVGGVAQVKFAELSKGLVLTAANFIIV